MFNRLALEDNGAVNPSAAVILCQKEISVVLPRLIHCNERFVAGAHEKVARDDRGLLNRICVPTFRATLACEIPSLTQDNSLAHSSKNLTSRFGRQMLSKD